MMARTYISSTLEADIHRTAGVWSQPSLHRETLSHKQINDKKEVT